MRSLLDLTLTTLGIKHTWLYVEALEREYPYPNSLWALTRMLDRYNVHHSSLRITDKERIRELPLPFVAEVGGDCVVVTELTNDFMGRWSGVTVLLQADDYSTEPDYEQHKRAQCLARTESTVGIISAVLLLIAFLLWHRPDIAASGVIALSAIGLYLSYLLLKLHIHAANRAADKICSRFGGHSSCSDTSRLHVLGRYDLSECGIVFFGVNLALMTFGGTAFYTALACVTVAALPFTVWSICYQRFKLHRWCPLCVLAQLAVWGQFALVAVCGDSSHIAISVWSVIPLVIVVCGYLLALIITHYAVMRYGGQRVTEVKLNEARGLKYDSKVWN